eukprot:SAG11_NODE_50_length_19992_cov_9.945157_6_plen_66_part_00
MVLNPTLPIPLGNLEGRCILASYVLMRVGLLNLVEPDKIKIIDLRTPATTIPTLGYPYQIIDLYR